MSSLTDCIPQSEAAFTELVAALAADPGRREQLTDLLREDHPVYAQRGSATVVRMRGWILVALTKAGVSDSALAFVLDELDTGIDPYLVAAAARAMRSYPRRVPAFAAFVMHALGNVRYRDDPVSFDEYGGYALDAESTSPVIELLHTLAWLGPAARDIRQELEPLAAPGGLPEKRLPLLDQALKAIRSGDVADEQGESTCCALEGSLADMFRRTFSKRARTEAVESVVFEDQNGDTVGFDAFFKGRPSIVAFFYTRCDNPLKCSLTVTKVARVQKLLDEKGFAERIRTAAITYDPAFDLHDRLLAYGRNRGVRMDSDHRMLRPIGGVERLRAHFSLGVNFVESLVNRHRVEAYVLDAKGRIAASFERIRWNEKDVVNRAIEVLTEEEGARVDQHSDEPNSNQWETVRIAAPGMSIGESSPPFAAKSVGGEAGKADVSVVRRSASSIFGTLASFAVAFFPKCPVCWAAYLSFFGIAALERIPYAPWLLPLLAAAVLVNVGSVWLRARTSGRFGSFYLVAVGAAAIFASNLGVGAEELALVGVVSTLAGSLLSAVNRGGGKAFWARRTRPA